MITRGPGMPGPYIQGALSMPPSFEVPQGVRFTCTQCGDCCRDWNVPLGPGERERLAALDWRGKADDLVGAEVTVSSAAPGMKGRHRLARRENGACVFLGEASQCRIHERFGGDVKPLACQLYPFGFHAVSGAIAVDVAYSCRAVSLSHGEPVAARTLEWARLLDEVPSKDEARHALARGRPVSGQVLWELEHYLLGFLAQASLPLLDRVRACLLFTRLATTGDPETPAASSLRRAVAAGIPKSLASVEADPVMDKSQRAVFWQWLFLALNPTPPGFFEAPRREQEKETRRRVAAGNAFRDNEGRPWVDGCELSRTFEEIRAIDARSVLADTKDVVGTFFRAKVVGQRFLAGGAGEIPFVEAVPRLLLCLPMLVWTSRALAAERGAAAAEEQDVRRGLRLLDRTLGQLTLESLPKKQAEACRFVFTETDVVVSATREFLGV